MCISLLCLADGPNGKPNEYAAGCGLGWPVLHGIPWNFNTQAFDIYREGLALQVNALYGTTGRRIFMSHRGALGPIIQRISLLQTGDVALVILPSRDKCFLNHLANCSSAANVKLPTFYPTKHSIAVSKCVCVIKIVLLYVGYKNLLFLFFFSFLSKAGNDSNWIFHRHATIDIFVSLHLRIACTKYHKQSIQYSCGSQGWRIVHWSSHIFACTLTTAIDHTQFIIGASTIECILWQRCLQPHSLSTQQFPIKHQTSNSIRKQDCMQTTFCWSSKPQNPHAVEQWCRFAHRHRLDMNSVSNIIIIIACRWWRPRRRHIAPACENVESNTTANEWDEKKIAKCNKSQDIRNVHLWR